MLVECYDEKGAEVYELIIKQIFQDLVLGPSVDDLRAFINPDEPVFILAIKMKKTASEINLGEVANLMYNKEENVTKIFIDDENYLPNILKRLWFDFQREDLYQPNRYEIDIDGNQTHLKDLVVDSPHSNLQRRIYDAIFRILPEGFRIIKDISTENIIAVVATDELIKDEWLERAQIYIKELE